MDRIEEHLRKYYPHHLGGYFKGWLETKKVDGGIHIYNRDSEGKRQIITTILNKRR